MIPELDPETKSLLEADGAQVRTELATPLASRRPAQPNHWKGNLLNLFLPGAGLLLVRRQGEGIAWALAAIGAAFTLPGGLGWPAAILGSALHYKTVYDRLYPSFIRNKESPRPNHMNLVFLLLVVGVLLLAYIFWSMNF